MKRSLFAGLAILTIAAITPAVRVAADTATTAPTVPSDCWVDFPLGGPSRAPHGAPATVATSYEGPNCSEVPGICVTVINLPDGPSRATHSRPALPAPCVPLGEACDITYDYGADRGPARPAHQVSAPIRPRLVSGDVVDIPPACEELMVLALTPTGSDTAPTIWIATAFLGAGAVLIIAPRRLARR